MSKTPSGLAATLKLTANQMKLEVEKIRSQSDHPGFKGTALEREFKRFLQRHLPGSVGVTSGQVVDSSGGRSGQLDVIIYDRQCTPMLFSHADDGDHSVPVEGVIAVVEVKMHLKRTLLEGLLASCRSLKQLEKSAYLPQSGLSPEPLSHPVYYSVFAFESDSTYCDPLNEMQLDVPPEERIDTVCYMDQGVSLNVDMDWQRYKSVFSPWPTSTSVLADTADGERALLHWFAGFSTAVAQARVRPIDLTRYLQDDLSGLSASFGDGAAAQTFTRNGITAVANNMGVRPEILHKFHDGKGLSLPEVLEVLRVDENYIAETEDMPEDSRRLLRTAKNLVRLEKQVGASSP